jgi:hypothetical protein
LQTTSKIIVLALLVGLYGPAMGKVIVESGRLDAPIRLKKPITVSYHSHWLLLGGVRVGYRPINATTEFNAFAGTAVTNGCGPQTKECIEEPAMNLGIRHYFSESGFAAYVGTNVHWLVKGIRFFQATTPMMDFSFGFNHQTQDHFTWGLGYSMFIFDAESSGLSPDTQGWMLSEFGYSF